MYHKLAAKNIGLEGRRLVVTLFLKTKNMLLEKFCLCLKKFILRTKKFNS